MKTICVDADYLRYNSGFACEHWEYLVANEEEVYEITKDKREARKVAEQYGLPIYSRVEVEPESHIKQTVKAQLQKIVKECEAKFNDECQVRVYLTGVGNFRERVATMRLTRATATLRISRKPLVLLPNISQKCGGPRLLTGWRPMTLFALRRLPRQKM